MRFSTSGLFLDFKVWLTKPALVRAAKSGNVGKIRKLLARGVPVDIRDGFGRTALMEASRGGHLEIVKLLLNYGADVGLLSGSGKPAMFYARDRLARELLSEAENSKGELSEQGQPGSLENCRTPLRKSP